ncbi:putative acireductone synthase UTR4 [Ascoidea rubescens DSM 1968]|uniref:Enolase-phosphatase E1 n=1 Tax=Ascoidea rubescens DSM 1968 TaxID=1344418 RepID=A0A1D2VAZ6_9ASCO|nr:enolase-phosphatase E1 [Ascoidea rubescens DSM 1968]ODV58617.1 enolase-phosphatase E1 [Ascoidea rubescens DSM 1968]
MASSIAIVLDIEGTICPISFVKDVLFPYFLKKIPDVLNSIKFPISNATVKDPQNEKLELIQILSSFPEDKIASKEKLLDYINYLVSNDIKEKALKNLQGLIWRVGYENGEIVCDLFSDAFQSIKDWSTKYKIYIYSSGSVKAQKLLLKYARDDSKPKSCIEDLNPYITDYFDINTSGYKFQKESYESIKKFIGLSSNHLLFFSDNLKELIAAKAAGFKGFLVIRPGNYEPNYEKEGIPKGTFKTIDNFNLLGL